MFDKLKSLPALAALAGGTILSIGLTSAPAQAACGTVTLASLLVPGASVICGDKEFSAFQSIDFGVPTNVEFAQTGPETYEVKYLFSSPIGTGIYIPVYNVKVLDTTKTILPPGWAFTAIGNPASVSSDVALTPLNPPPMASYLVDSDLSIGGTTTVTSWSHIYTQTPGPLPILGAGAAFGFSRKLRRRIKSVV
jgi:hypothetical protein